MSGQQTKAEERPEETLQSREVGPNCKDDSAVHASAQNDSLLFANVNWWRRQQRKLCQRVSVKNVTMFWRISGGCQGTAPDQRVVVTDTLAKQPQRLVLFPKNDGQNLVSNINEELSFSFNLFGLFRLL